jgi:hypothetical protein
VLLNFSGQTDELCAWLGQQTQKCSAIKMPSGVDRLHGPSSCATVSFLFSRDLLSNVFSVDTVNMKKIFADEQEKCFYIPAYQRPYSWKKVIFQVQSNLLFLTLLLDAFY